MSSQCRILPSIHHVARRKTRRGIFLAAAVGFCVAAGVCAPSASFGRTPLPAFLRAEGYYDGAEMTARQDVAPGVVYRFDSVATGPLTFHTVFADVSRLDLRLEVEKGLGQMFRGETVPRMVQRLYNPEARPIVAINADFWGDRHIPIGLFVDEGTIWRSPDRQRSVFAFNYRGEVAIGTPVWEVTVRGPGATDLLPVQHINFPDDQTDTVVYTWPLGATAPAPPAGWRQAVLRLETPLWIPNLPARARAESVGSSEAAQLNRSTVVVHTRQAEADWLREGVEVTLRAELGNVAGPVTGVVGGGPRLVEKGRNCAIEANRREHMSPAFATDRHPRTALGLLADGKTLVLVVVDGRQADRSIGINLSNLADYMISLGCVEAMNLDGGGSSTMVIRGELANFPSDASGARAVTNALLLRRTAPVGPLRQLRIRPRNALIPPECMVPLAAYGFDEGHEPVSMAGWAIQWKAEGAGATIHPDGRLKAGDAPGVIRVRAEALPSTPGLTLPPGIGAPEATTQFTVALPARIAGYPEALLLGAGDEAPVRFEATTEDGRPFLRESYLWEVTVPPFLRYNPEEQVLKALGAGQGHVTARMADWQVRIPVAVDQFKTTTAYSFDTLPAADPAQWIEGLRHNPAGTSIQLDTVEKKEGAASWRFTYAMAKGGTTKIALPIEAKLPGKPLAVGLWIYGDGKAQWLRGELRDAGNNGYYLDFTQGATGIKWEGEWRYARASLVAPSPMTGSAPPHPRPPLTLKNLYLVQPQEAAKRDGEIRLDGLEALALPEELTP